jgi:hypothetical protein
MMMPWLVSRCTSLQFHFIAFLQATILLCGALGSQGEPLRAQELEVRRWNHLPIGLNSAGGGYALTKGQVAFDPVLQLEQVKFESHAFPVKYLRSFELLRHSARFEVWQAYQIAHWNGTLAGEPARTTRTGWSDMTMRWSVNLLGAPPLKADEFAAYRQQVDSESILGVGLAIQVPTGHYINDRLINLGNNRFTFRPQIGFVRNFGKWSTESTLSVSYFTDNNDFFGGNYLEQAPLYALEGHFDYSFRPGVWMGAGMGYGLGAASTINGVHKNDDRENLGLEASAGYSVTQNLGFKLSYLGIRTQVPLGADSDTIAVGASLTW